MRRVILMTMLILVFSQAGVAVGDAQEERPSRARCEEAVREGLAALTLKSVEEVDAILEDWGGPETAEALGLPEGCAVPEIAPGIQPLPDGSFQLCIWWNPRTGVLGEILDSAPYWDWGWQECIGPPAA